MLHSVRGLALSICVVVAMLALSQKDAVAGEPIMNFSNPAFGSNAASASGWLAGAHAGYTWQQGQVVFGFETDLQATGLKSSMTGGLMYNPPMAPPPGDFASTSASINWYGTLRARLGFASGPWLFYGTGGLAYGDIGLSSYFSTAGLSLVSLAADQRAGWVGGAGFEYLITPNVSVGLSYQYVDLGMLHLSSSTTDGFTVIGQTASSHAQFQAVMAGMSWHFAPTSPSAPWAGGYVGGHMGGAWGNNAGANYTSFVPLFAN